MEIKKINDQLSVAPQIQAAELTQVKALGFVSVINNRPDKEEANQPTAADVQQQAEALGLSYQYQPVISGQITDEDIVEFQRLLAAEQTPILAFCRTGTRCTMLWALASATTDNIDELVNTAAAAGYDLNALKPRMIALATKV